MHAEIAAQQRKISLRNYFNFRLEFRVDPSGIGFDLVTTIPIRIGTIPLRAVFQSWPSYTGSRVQNSQPTINAEGDQIQIQEILNRKYCKKGLIEIDLISSRLYILGGSGWVLPSIPPSTAPPYVPPSAPPIPLEGFDDLPPPTYEQAISADEGTVIQIRDISG